MKLVTYRYKKHKTAHVGLFTKDEKGLIPIASVLGEQYTSATMIDLINAPGNLTMPALQKALDQDDLSTIPLEKVDLLSPIQRGIHDMICVGENYLSHQEETAEKLISSEFLKTKSTIYFGKRASYILGDQEAIISRLDLDEALDYEVELGVIIGDYGYQVPVEKAKDIIFGFTIINDLSSRNLQVKHHQWYRGKSLDHLTAMGPCIVTADEFQFPIALNLQSFVDGEIRQQSTTKLMMRSIEAIIAEISDGITLEPGDIIATGTPAGVGAGFEPPLYLKKGQWVQCQIEGIGSLSNVVK